MLAILSLTRVQGGSIKICSLTEDVQRVEVLLLTDGRPLNANVKMRSGPPDNAPQKTSEFVEDGLAQALRATIECIGSSNSVAIRTNTGPMELLLPMTAGIETNFSDKDSNENPTDGKITSS